MIRALGHRLRAIVNAPRLHVAAAWPWLRRGAGGPVRSILVIRPDQIGDFVLGTPLLLALRAAHPDAALHLVVVPGLVDLARGCPLAASVTALPGDLAVWAPARQAPISRVVRLAWFAARRLRRLRPDLAVVPRVDSDAHGAALLALFSGAPRRCGFAEANSPYRARDNAGFDAYFTDVVALPGPVHEVVAARTMAAALGAAGAGLEPTVWSSAADDDAIARRIGDLGLDERPFLVVAPGATFAFRRWPAASFATAIRPVVGAGGTRAVIVGSAADRAAAGEMLRLLPPGTCHDHTGGLSLGETIALLRRATLFVGNDSGPLHLAAAAGVPCVEISSFPRDGAGSHHNSPVRFGPWNVRHRILQPATARPPCHGACTAAEAHCILAVEPSAVTAAIRDLAPALAAAPDPEPFSR